MMLMQSLRGGGLPAIELKLTAERGKLTFVSILSTSASGDDDAYILQCRNIIGLSWCSKAREKLMRHVGSFGEDDAGGCIFWSARMHKINTK